MSHRNKALIAATATAVALAIPGAATAAPRTSNDAFTRAPSHGRLSATVSPRALDPDAKVNVMVELSGDPVAVAEAKADRTFSRSERNSVKAKLRKAQVAIDGGISARGGKVLARLQSAYNGVQVRITRSKADALATLPGVVAVHELTPKKLDNTVSVPFLGVPQVWQDTGYTGRNVKVAIIDTGIDYTHADFGGPGTPEAYQAAHAASTAPADPALFGPAAPRVKGGYDFVGDNYDAGGSGAALVPVPDENPLDCQGHGSHVAGTAAGSGVTADGKTYTGPYNADTPATSFKVGPGVAPEADLYALRVFGCGGSTDVTVQAIDWAVDHGMDVINMSLGSSFGSPSDPDAVASSNAVAAGVVVVASAGNDGPNPYLTGTPASGHGVLSVSAVDSTASFPGADIHLGASTIPAINANGADLPSTPLTVVSVEDNPATDANEALGCSVEAFTDAGIVPGGNQIAVVSRGTCARVAKAIYGQQAGAAAVVMVNSDANYPPFEGVIKENPDTGDPYLVTIPFLGVRSTDGPALRAADGQTLTLSASTLDNPGFRNYASFSSGGPASIDSSVKPNVSAPGVSISSAAVGTGSDAVVESGTSMAAPHVAGVAALTVQAHPSWRAQDIAATLGSTADPDKLGAYDPRVGGGLVDAAQSVATTTFATGDAYRTTSGRIAAPSLSFGFSEPSSTVVKTKVLRVTNRGSRAVTYRLSSTPADGSVAASIRFSKRTVRVPAHGSAQVRVKLVLRASSVGSTLGDDLFNFYAANGNVVLTSSKGTLRVPYLLVPRAQANVVGSLTKHLNANSVVNGAGAPAASGSPSPSESPSGSPSPSESPSPTASPSPTMTPAPGSVDVKLSNPRGALDADADFYTWGLSDGRDATRYPSGSGYDLRAAGVQSVDTDDGKLVVFAVNMYDRYSNAASNEYDVPVDTDGDGKADWIVFSYDSGAVRTGDANGITEVFLVDVKTGSLGAAGYYAVAPTDNSTILLPVLASDLGLTSASGGFHYSAASYSATSVGTDEMSGWAAYDPWARAITDAEYVTVPRNGRVTVSLAVDPAAMASQMPLGVMVVVFDNHSGWKEALLLGVN